MKSINQEKKNLQAKERGRKQYKANAKKAGLVNPLHPTPTIYRQKAINSEAYGIRKRREEKKRHRKYRTRGKGKNGATKRGRV